MDLTSNFPFWAVKNGIPHIYPALERDVMCKVAILGGGVTGALAAEELSRIGMSVCLIDSREIGHGSSSASTALLQYEIDTHLIELTRIHDWETASAAYRACHESIDLIEETISRLAPDDYGFRRCPSVYLASLDKDVKALREEAAARRKAGIELEVWESDQITEHLGLGNPLALMSPQAAEVDVFRLTHGLLQRALKNGAQIYDRTRITQVDTDGSCVRIKTDRETEVIADFAIVALGYETSELFKTSKYVNLNSSFAVASAPIANNDFWWERCLLWESARPYFYLRSDSQGRAIIGGDDEKFRSPAARDALIPKKASSLQKRFGEMFPQIPFEPEYSWAGTFGETKDGLPFIGELDAYPRCLFSLGYGGNGITYSQIAAKLHAATLQGLSHPLHDVFGFNRL